MVNVAGKLLWSGKQLSSSVMKINEDEVKNVKLKKMYFHVRDIYWGLYNTINEPWGCKPPHLSRPQMHPPWQKRHCWPSQTKGQRWAKSCEMRGLKLLDSEEDWEAGSRVFISEHIGSSLVAVSPARARKVDILMQSGRHRNGRCCMRLMGHPLPSPPTRSHLAAVADVKHCVLGLKRLMRNSTDDTLLLLSPEV